MPNAPTNKKQLRILIVLIVAFACMLLYPVLKNIDIPTQASNARLRVRLAERQADFNTANEAAAQYTATLEEARREYSSLEYDANLERNAQAKLDKILDRISLTRGKTNITTVPNKNKSNIQEVTITFELEDITMRRFSEFLMTFEQRALEGKTPLYLKSITVSPKTVRRSNGGRPGGPGRPQEPEQPTNQRQLSISVGIASYSLYPTASDLLFTRTPSAAALVTRTNTPQQSKSPAPQQTPRANTGAPAQKGTASKGGK